MYLAAAAAICRIKFKNKFYKNTPVWTINAQFLQSSNVHAKVTSLLQYIHLMMIAQDWAESTREPINHGRFINQFLLDIIKLTHQLERINA